MTATAPREPAHGKLIERLARIPDSARRFTCGAREARAFYGLDASLLDALLQAGLPASMKDGEPLLDVCDLYYVGMRLRRAAPYLWAVRCWADGLERFSRCDETAVDVRWVPHIATPGGAQVGVVHLSSAGRREVLLEHGRPVAEERIVLRGSWPALPPALTRVLRELAADLDFCMLPPSLHGDLAFARRTGLVDCVTAARVVAEELQAVGARTRVESGLLVSLPRSVPHCWATVQVGDLWVPSDPVLIGVMRQFGGLAAAAWPLERSVGPIMAGIEGMSMGRSDDVEMTFPTAVADAPAAA